MGLDMCMLDIIYDALVHVAASELSDGGKGEFLDIVELFYRYICILP